MALTVIATLRAKKGLEQTLFGELKALLAPTRAEAVSVIYDMHRSIEEPGTFTFFEIGESRPHWDAHMHGRNEAFPAGAGQRKCGRIPRVSSPRQGEGAGRRMRGATL